MASGTSAAPSLFLRNATGLVKGWSGFDAFTFLAIAYAGLIAVMPRAGGDYVWQSRVLDGIPGVVSGAVVGVVGGYVVGGATLGGDSGALIGGVAGLVIGAAIGYLRGGIG